MKSKEKDDLSVSPPAPPVMVGPLDDMGSHEEAKAKAAAKAPKAKGKTYTVTIHSNNGDNSDVLLGHNYVLNQYKRNVPVQMNENFLQVLKDSVVQTTVQSADGVNSSVSIPQYAYTVE